MLIYNLQFFAEDNDNEGTDNPSNDSVDNDTTSVDTEAFAELISERDKKITELENEMKALKKSNADLLLKISSKPEQKKSFEENLLEMVGAKPRKE